MDSRERVARPRPDHASTEPPSACGPDSRTSCRDEIGMVDKTRVKEAVLPNVLDVLDVIHEERLEHLTTVNNRC